MRSALLLISAFALISGTASAQSPTALGGVSGHVYCADSHTPCRFASVIIQSAPHAKNSNPRPATAPSHSYSTATDIDGSFEIRGVAPGDYYILGRLAGYLSLYDLASSEYQGDPALSSKAIDIALTRITIDSGQTTTSNLTLSRGASIGGTVEYDDGGHGINVPVQIFRKDTEGRWKPYQNRAGDATLAPLGFAPHTDDRGRFYEPALPPGVYTVEASLPESTIVPTTIVGRQSLNVNITTGDALRVFNGNKYRLRDTVPIEVHEGEDRSDVDIILPTTGLHSIHGFVTAKSDGSVIAHGSIHLLDSDDKTTLRETSIQEDGSFSFNYVVDGPYIVQIDPQANNRDSKSSAGYQPLTTPLLVENDIPNLIYALVAAKR